MGAIGLDGTTASYTPIAFLIAAYGIYLLRDLPDVGRGLIIGASLLGLSLTFRALDIPLCDQWPIGTHFVWHLLNGVMLGWMIEVYRRHRLSIAAEQS